MSREKAIEIDKTRVIMSKDDNNYLNIGIRLSVKESEKIDELLESEPEQKKYSYCAKHDTYPADDEPCWHCINEHEKKSEPENPMYRKGDEQRTGDETKFIDPLQEARKKAIEKAGGIPKLSESEAGEFTKKTRELSKERVSGGMSIFWYRKKLDEACDRIDRLEAENKELKKIIGVKTAFIIDEARAKKQRALETQELRAELSKAEAELKDKDKKIAEIKRNQFPPNPICERCGKPRVCLGVMWDTHGNCKP